MIEGKPANKCKAVQACEDEERRAEERARQAAVQNGKKAGKQPKKTTRAATGNANLLTSARRYKHARMRSDGPKSGPCRPRCRTVRKLANSQRRPPVPPRGMRSAASAIPVERRRKDMRLTRTALLFRTAFHCRRCTWSRLK